MFDNEQWLVIEYILVVVIGDVLEVLFDWVKVQFGEFGVVEFIIGVVWWLFWVMICNVILFEYDFGYVYLLYVV